jgi:diacylglycerol kinase family enzyme
MEAEAKVFRQRNLATTYHPRGEVLKLQRVSVLLNSFAGQSQGRQSNKLRGALEETFKTHSISASLDFLAGKDLRAGAERALQRVVEGEVDAIIVGGGDGTISTVASVLVGSGVPLGIIPLGTLNHFAKDLQIPLAIEEAVALVVAGNSRNVDVGEVNGRVFINNSSIGIYPFLVHDRERRTRLGLPKWFAMLLAGVRAFRYFPLHRLSICTADWTEAYRSPCVFVGNNLYHISAPALGTRMRLDQGQLCLHLAKHESRLALIGLACRSFLGLLQQQDLRTFSPLAVEISSHHRRLLVAFDGEIEIMQSPLKYRIRPAALRVFAPPVADN